jgi:hypothetical protein
VYFSWHWKPSVLVSVLWSNKINQPIPFKELDPGNHSNKMNQIVYISLQTAKMYCHWVLTLYMQPTKFAEPCSITSVTDASRRSQILKSTFTGL